MLLRTESAAEFAALRARFITDIRPQTAIETMYCDDIVYLVWDGLRLRRWKAAILNFTFRDVLYKVLVERLGEVEAGQETAATLEGWVTDTNLRDEVSDILNKHGLDESIIEAEAFRRCAAELVRLEQLLASSESRRDKALQGVAFYRASFARQLRDQATQVMQSEVQRLEFKSSGRQK